MEAFVRHRDRKCTFDGDGKMLRRRLLVRRSKIVGLGKEANHIEAGRVLGQHAVGGRAKTYVDPDPFNGSATEVAKRLGVSRRTVCNWRKTAVTFACGGGSDPGPGRRRPGSPRATLPRCST